MKKLKYLKNYYNLFALLYLVTSMVLFIYMIIEIGPEIGEAIKYLFNIDVTVEEYKDITGFDVVTNSKALFYLFMFTFQLIYSLYGLFVLFTKNDERRVFKVMFRSIFYVSGLLMFYNIFAVIVFLVMPIQDIHSIVCVLFMILALIVAVNGRIVSNYGIFTMTLTARKKLGLFVVVSYIALCLLSFLVLDGEYHTEANVFYSLQILSSIFAIPMTILYTDRDPITFEKEPKFIEEVELVDISDKITSLRSYQFKKNIKLTRATINNQIQEIPTSCFSNAINLREVYLPSSLKSIERLAFFNCERLEAIYYQGSVEEFEKIEKDPSWLYLAKTNLVYCSDGVYHNR